jgi:hypothetical protein
MPALRRLVIWLMYVAVAAPLAPLLRGAGQRAEAVQIVVYAVVGVEANVIVEPVGIKGIYHFI